MTVNRLHVRTCWGSLLWTCSLQILLTYINCKVNCNAPERVSSGADHFKQVCLLLPSLHRQRLLIKGNGSARTYAGGAQSGTPDRNDQYLKGKGFHKNFKPVQWPRFQTQLRNYLGPHKNSQLAHISI